MRTELERTTIRMVAWRLLPLLLLAYLAAYIDRINIGFAGAALKHDLGFSNTVLLKPNSFFRATPAKPILMRSI